MGKYKNFIFDIDGTLWDTSAVSARAYTDAIREYGKCPQIEVTAALIRREFGKTIETIFQDLFPDTAQDVREEVMRLCDIRNNQYLKGNGKHMFYPGVQDTLERLRHLSGCGLYIVSNCYPDYVELLLDEGEGFRQLFSDYHCLTRPCGRKAENLRALADRYHLTNAAYVGDTETDRQSCQEAGLPFVYAAYGFGEVRDCTERVMAFPDILRYA